MLQLNVGASLRRWFGGEIDLWSFRFTRTMIPLSTTRDRHHAARGTQATTAGGPDLPARARGEHAPRLLVVCRSFEVASEIWIRRQLAGFNTFDIHVLCWEPIREAAPAPQVRVYSLGLDFDRPERSLWRWWRRALSAPSGNFQGAFGEERRRLLAAVRQIAPDIVLCHFGTTALRILPVTDQLNLPVVAHFHGFDISSSLRNRYYCWSLRRSGHRFAGCVVVGSHQQQALMDLGVPARRIRCIPCGAPTGEFLPKTTYTTDRCRFIAVSRMVPWKGVEYSLRAFHAALRGRPDIELHLVGTGPSEPRLKAYVAAHQLERHVIFHGPQPPEEVRRLMRASDVFVQHSLDDPNGWKEGFGVSIAEASACGLPVIVTDSGGIPDQITHGQNGLITPQRDVAAMARHMVQLAGDAAARERLGTAGRERAQRDFDSTRLARQLEELMLALARPRSGGRAAAGAFT